jgi:transposase
MGVGCAAGGFRRRFADAAGARRLPQYRPTTLNGARNNRHAVIHYRQTGLEGWDYAQQDFQIDWAAEKVTCPQGVASDRWLPLVDGQKNEVIQVRFPRQACHSCATWILCTRSITQPRILILRPQAQYEALQDARQAEQTDEWKERYDKRAGIEGGISQAVRGFGLRECRYIGLAKTHLQHVLTAVAINFARLDNWFTGKKRAQTRVSRFAALRPVAA